MNDEFNTDRSCSARSLTLTAMGEENADLVLENSKLVNVNSKEITEDTDVAIKGDKVALIGDADHTIGDNTKVINCEDYYLSPGLIDVHTHIEASMVSPTQFARAVLPKGNTSVLWDPVWSANVLGKEGLRIFLEEGNKTPLKLYANAPTGVPPAPTELITPGYEFSVDDLEEILAWDKVVGLGELVKLNKVLEGEKSMHERIRCGVDAAKKIIGSAPQRTGHELNAYASAGAQTCHEATTVEEAVERLRLGMRLVIREGSSMRNLEELIKVVTEEGMDSRHCVFCVDDKDILEIRDEGLVDYMVRESIEQGVDPVEAIQMASLNAAEHLGIDRNVGSIAPGRKADILFLDDLESFSVEKVMADGEMIAKNGDLIKDLHTPSYPDWIKQSIELKRKVESDDFKIKTEKKKEAKVNVIKAFKDQIISLKETETLKVRNSNIQPDTSKDVLKVAVIERYGKTEPSIGKGFVKGFGLKEGAIAISVTPDVHHMIVVGIENKDLSKAINRLVELEGGIVIANNGEIIDELPLPIGGLVSQDPYEKIGEKLKTIRDKTKEMGCVLPSPFMTIAFVGCPTLTEFKISDKGLVDVLNYELVPLEAE